MEAASAEPRVREPTPEGRQNVDVLELFAQDMAENILQSFLSQMETDCWTSTFNHNQETLAEELASAVLDVALREVCQGRNIESSSGVKTDGGDPEIQTSKDSRTGHPPLSQSGLPVMGSLDYPDAPPTTPFLPELERSRRSFARKLKGGLATVYLPSPPPPTPKEDDIATDNNNPPVELMEHLMNSLSIDELAKDCFEVGTKMEAFADVFSRDIIDWVLSDEIREQRADGGDLHRLAQRLADTIITSSLDEAKMLL